MTIRVRDVVLTGVLTAALIPTTPLFAQGRARQDTARQGRLTAEELHRQRREALAAERAGLGSVELPRYGSAVVGVPGAGRATGNLAGGAPGGAGPRAGRPGPGSPGPWSPAAGEVPVICTGVMRALPRSGGGGPDLVPGTFRGDCRPADGFAWEPGQPAGEAGEVGPAGGGRGTYGPGDPWGAYGGPGGLGPSNPYAGFGPQGGPFGSYGPYAGYGPQGGTGLQWGAGEYYWTPFGLMPARPFGWPAGPGGAFAFSWPGFTMGECARVRVSGPGQVRTEIFVGRQALGLADPSDLDLSIDARLSRGEVVELYGLDGRVLRLAPGIPYDDVRVLPCSLDVR
jgi:hypothetical protein